MIHLILLIIIIIIIIVYILSINKKEKFTLNTLIPKVIYLTYKTKNIPDYIISNLQTLYPKYEIKLYDNMDCIDFLRKEYDETHVDIFNYIKDGPIKSDFWRVCILNKYGGIYSDIDIDHRIAIDEIIEDDTVFLTCISNNPKNINPHFLVSTANNIVLQKCLEIYLEYYNSKKKYTYWGWSIVYIMQSVLNDILNITTFKENIVINNNNKYQFLKEIMPFNILKLFMKNDSSHYCKYKDQIILYNRYEKYKNHNFI